MGDGPSVSALMARAAADYAGRPAIRCGERELSFAESWERGLRLASVLRERGLREGDRVGVLEGNELGSADLIAATAAAGLVRVPLYLGAAHSQHRRILERTGARGLVAGAGQAEEAVALAEAVSRLGPEQAIVRGSGYEALLATSEPLAEVASPRPADVHLIRHTGGTTGAPKGVPISHRSWLASCRDWFFGQPPLELGDRCLNVSPIAHGAGYFFTPAWLSGACNVLVDRPAPAELAALLESERIAVTFMVPAMLAGLLQDKTIESRDWSALRVIAIAGAPVTEPVLRRAREVFGDVVFQAYGQTEAVPASWLTPGECYAQIEGSEPLRSAGRRLPFAELEIRGPDGEPLPPGEIGEIALRCDGQMEGYLDDPEATARALRDGWVLTGDAGSLDANGYLYVLDRIADAIVVQGGATVWPSQLENAIAADPRVAEVAVFGHDGEVTAVVVVPGGEEPTAGDLPLDDNYYVPRVVVRREALPRSPVGKVQREALRGLYATAPGSRQAGAG